MICRCELRAAHRLANPACYAPLSEAGMVIAARMWRDGFGTFDIADRLGRHESVIAGEIEAISEAARSWAHVAEAAE